MGVATGVVIGVASRTPTMQNSWIRPCLGTHTMSWYYSRYLSTEGDVGSLLSSQRA